MDELNNEYVNEVTGVDVATSEQPVEEKPVEQIEVQKPQEDKAAVRYLREQKQRLERENIELANRLRQVEEAKKASYDPDDLMQRKHFDEELQQIKKEIAKSTSEYKLAMRYPDFDKVVNDDTIQLLKEKYPSLATTIGEAYHRDQYNGSAAAYDAIKNLGLYNEDIYAADRQRAQSNASKPRSVQSISPSKSTNPIAEANAFNVDNKDYMTNKYKEMLYYANKK
jgi:hypothetical protein